MERITAKKVALNTGVLFLLFVFFTSIISSVKTVKAGKAATIWYSSYLFDWAEQYWPGETSEATSVHAYIYYLFDTYCDYEFLGNYYGGAASKNTILNTISMVNNNYDYGAVWHYGHGTTYTIYGVYKSWFSPRPYYIPVTHYRYWDSFGESVFDYEIYPRTGLGAHKFVFMWTCGSAQEIGYYDANWQNWFGYYIGTGAVGLPFAWLHTNSLSSDGYANPGSTPCCFIGFYNSVRPLSVIAANGKTYGAFVKAFYRYALQEGKTIKQALDEAASEVWGNGYTFTNTDLYYGYWQWVPPPKNMTVWSQMRVYGNANNIIPN